MSDHFKIIPATQLQAGDIILGDNERPANHRDIVISRNTILVGGRVSVLVSRSTSKRHPRVLFNPQTAILIWRPGNEGKYDAS